MIAAPIAQALLGRDFARHDQHRRPCSAMTDIAAVTSASQSAAGHRRHDAVIQTVPEFRQPDRVGDGGRVRIVAMRTRSWKGALLALLVVAAVGCSSSRWSDRRRRHCVPTPCGDAAACPSAQLCVSEQSCGTPDCHAGSRRRHLSRRNERDAELPRTRDRRAASPAVRRRSAARRSPPAAQRRQLRLRGVALFARNLHRAMGTGRLQL